MVTLILCIPDSVLYSFYKRLLYKRPMTKFISRFEMINKLKSFYQIYLTSKTSYFINHSIHPSICLYPRVKDSVPAVMIAIVLFGMPSTLPCMSTYLNYSHPQKQYLPSGSSPGQKGQRLLRLIFLIEGKKPYT